MKYLEIFNYAINLLKFLCHSIHSHYLHMAMSTYNAADLTCIEAMQM
jgi:hypothetical protein